MPFAESLPTPGTAGPISCPGPDQDPDPGTEHPPCEGGTVWETDSRGDLMLTCARGCGFYRYAG